MFSGNFFHTDYFHTDYFHVATAIVVDPVDYIVVTSVRVKYSFVSSPRGKKSYTASLAKQSTLQPVNSVPTYGATDVL